MLVGILLAAMSLMWVAPAGAASLPAPPKSAFPAPEVPDPLANYVGQNSCDQQVYPGTKALLNLAISHYGRGRSLGIIRACGVGGQSEHKEGRALDWGLNVYNSADKAAGDAFAQWVSANNGAAARSLGIMYVIWNRKVWKAYQAAKGWQDYKGASPHTDHIHISLSWAGALLQTSFWTGRTSVQDYGPCRAYQDVPAAPRVAANPAPCAAPKPLPQRVSKRTYWPGESSADIALIQRPLGVAADGAFGAKTRAALLAFQRRAGLPQNGAIDALVWAKLVPATIIPPKVTPPVVKLEPTPVPESKPLPNAPSSEVVAEPRPSVPVQAVPAPAPTRLAAYKSLMLRLRSRGEPVKVVQRIVGLQPTYRTGYFGSMTLAAVKKFQWRYRLPITGVVDQRTWTVLERKLVTYEARQRAKKRS